jgi:NhaC family Na+:H+ antiporter
MAAVLGVPTLVYLPYAIFNYVSPMLDILYGYTGFTIARITDEPAETVALPAEPAHQFRAP